MSSIEEFNELAIEHYGNEGIFSDGASMEEIELLQNEIGMELPPEVASAYSTFNGQKFQIPIVEGYWFNSLNHALGSWQEINEGLKEGFYSGLEGDCIGAVRPYYHHSHWFPVFGSDNQNLSVDLDPASGGTMGQLVEVLFDDELRVVVSNSIEEFFGRLVSMIHSGQLAYSDELQCFSSSEMGTVASLFEIA